MSWPAAFMVVGVFWTIPLTLFVLAWGNDRISNKDDDHDEEPDSDDT